MFVSTISKCLLFAFCAWVAGWALRATHWESMYPRGRRGGLCIGQHCRRGSVELFVAQKRRVVSTEMRHRVKGWPHGACPCERRGPALAGTDGRPGRSLGSVRLLQQLRLPAHRQVAAGHRLFLLLCRW